MNWRELPFLRILLPFILGIYVGKFWGPLVDGFFLYLALLGCLFSHSIFVQFKFSRLTFFLFFNGLFFLLGTQLSSNFYKAAKNIPLDQPVILQAYLLEDAEEKKSLKTTLQVKRIQFQGRSFACNFSILAYLKKGEKSIPAFGDLLSIQTKLVSISPPMNPGEFNYKDFLANKGIHFQAFVKSKDWEKQAEGFGFRLRLWTHKMRLFCEKIIDQQIESQQNRSILKALILGDKTELSKETYRSFTESGSIHILAVSGLHVGILWSILYFLLKPLEKFHPEARKVTAGIGLICIWLFAFFTGAGSPVLRACFIFSFVIIGRMFRLQKNTFNLLALSAFLILLYQPGQLFQIGFQFSFLAVTSIVLYYPFISKWFYFKYTLLQYAWSLVAVSLSAQILILPLSVYYFHQFPVYFFANSVLLIPLAYVLISASLGLFLAAYFKVKLDWISQIVEIFLSWMHHGVHTLAILPGHLIHSIYLSPFSVLLSYAVISFISIFIFLKKKAFFYLSIACLFLIAIQIPFSYFLNKSESKILISSQRESSNLMIYHRNFHFSWQSKNIDPQNLAFKISTFADKEKKEVSYPMKDGQSFRVADCLKTGNQIQLASKNILVWNSNPFPFNNKIKYDLLIVQNNQSLPPNLKLSEKAMVVFDNNNSPTFIQEESLLLQKNKTPFYIVKNHRAALIHFTKQDLLWKIKQFFSTKMNAEEFWL